MGLFSWLFPVKQETKPAPLRPIDRDDDLDTKKQRLAATFAPRKQMRRPITDTIFPMTGLWEAAEERIKGGQAGFRESDPSIAPFGNPDEGTDYDDRFYTSLGNISPMDLPAERLEEAQRLCFLTYRKNPYGHRTVELMNDFVLGDGLKIKADNEEIQDLLDNHWAVNNWEEKAPERLRSLSIFGEQLYPVFVNKDTGFVSVGEVSPFKIKGIKTDPENDAVGTHAVTSVGQRTGAEDGVSNGKIFELIHQGHEGKLKNYDKQNPAFYFAVNRVAGARRGQPDLLPALDWLEGLDGFAFSLLERAQLASNVVFDLEYKGLTDTEIKRKVDAFNATLRSGGTYGHNENSALTIKTPDINATDAKELNSVILKRAQAGTGFAGMFFGDSDDMTRASAAEISIPVAKRVKTRQKYFELMLRRILDFQIQMAQEIGGLSKDIDTTYEIQFPRIYLRDLQAATQSLKNLSEALNSAVGNYWIKRETAAKAFRQSLEEIGTTIQEEYIDIPQDDIVPPQQPTQEPIVPPTPEVEENGQEEEIQQPQEG